MDSSSPVTSRTALARRDFMSLMAQINRQWRRNIDRQLRPLGLTEAMWLPLLHLARASQPMRQKDLAASLSLDSSSVVRLLDGLEAAHFVERAENADRRAKTIQLTALGQATVAQVEERIGAGREALLSCVPAPALERAFQVLGKLAAALADAERDPPA
ncbi:MAG: MarR family winged helix-turn-helix transcriptional regulator [Janthinobacterium lividum]